MGGKKGERQIRTVNVRRLPVGVQVAVARADLETSGMSPEVVVAQFACRLARANVLPGVEEIGGVGKVIPFEGLEYEELCVNDRPKCVFLELFLNSGFQGHRSCIIGQ